MDTATYRDILATVVENGRVETTEAGFDRDSLEVEVDFEARERGLSADEIAEAIKYAMEHI